jgi:hypothetical protein
MAREIASFESVLDTENLQQLAELFVQDGVDGGLV